MSIDLLFDVADNDHINKKRQVNNWMMNVRVRRCRTKKIGLATGLEQITYPEVQATPKALAVNQRTGRSSSSSKQGGGKGGGRLALSSSSNSSSSAAMVSRTKRRVSEKKSKQTHALFVYEVVGWMKNAKKASCRGHSILSALLRKSHTSTNGKYFTSPTKNKARSINMQKASQKKTNVLPASPMTAVMVSPPHRRDDKEETN